MPYKSNRLSGYREHDDTLLKLATTSRIPFAHLQFLLAGPAWCARRAAEPSARDGVQRQAVRMLLLWGGHPLQPAHGGPPAVRAPHGTCRLAAREHSARAPACSADAVCAAANPCAGPATFSCHAMSRLQERLPILVPAVVPGNLTVLPDRKSITERVLMLGCRASSCRRRHRSRRSSSSRRRALGRRRLLIRRAGLWQGSAPRPRLHWCTSAHDPVQQFQRLEYAAKLAGSIL